MRDKNIVILEGVVGRDLKHGTASNGKKYVTFSLCVNTFLRELHDDTESEHPMAYIRVFVYNQRQLAYLDKVDLKCGNRVSIFGRLNSKVNEIKNKRIIQLNVVVRDITVSKRSADDDATSIDVPETSYDELDTNENK